MTIKEFEKKYDISFDGCFAYDALLRVGSKFRTLEDDLKDKFMKDFVSLKV